MLSAFKRWMRIEKMIWPPVSLQCNGQSPEGSWRERISRCVRWTWACCGCRGSSLIDSPPGSHDPQRYALREGGKRRGSNEDARYAGFFCWHAKCAFNYIPPGICFLGGAQPLTVNLTISPRSQTVTIFRSHNYNTVHVPLVPPPICKQTKANRCLFDSGVVTLLLPICSSVIVSTRDQSGL